MPKSETMANFFFNGIRSRQTARDGRMRIKTSVMMLNRHVNRMLSEKLRHLPSVMRVFQNFSTGEHAKMLTQKHAKFHSTMRAIKVQEAKNSSGSTDLLGAKSRMYCRRMTVLMIDITGLYKISFTQAHCCRVSPPFFFRAWRRRTNTTRWNCSSVMFH